MEFWESLIVLLHVLLFVYWLGGDLGVFYAGRFRNDPQYDPKTRLLLARIVGDIDMAPRTTMVLMIPSGFTLTAVKGYLTISETWLIAIWTFSFAWLALVWWLHIEKDEERKKPWSKFDIQLRWALTITLAVAAIYSFIEYKPIAQNFVALKLLIFAGTILCGIMIRVSMSVRRQHSWDRLRELRKGEFLAHRHTRGVDDERQNSAPSRSCGTYSQGYSPLDAQTLFS